MPEGVNIMSASDLMLTFLSHVSDFDVKYINGLNPFTIKVDGEETYIYIKNLSPAQLSNNNPDVWRIQLPMRDDFEKIKESESPFVLLGYDSENDVYTTWNPYWCKQRLNVGKSVSLYSRLSLQQRVKKSGEIEQLPLNNDGDVVCIPGNRIYEYMKSFKDYYPEETVFVAKNSSLQNRSRQASTPEELFAAFADMIQLSQLNDYAKYLLDNGRSKSTVGNYLNALGYVRENGLLAKYKHLFMSCQNYSQYPVPMKTFSTTDKIKQKDVSWHGAIRAALNRYVEFWQHKTETEPVQMLMFDLASEEPIEQRYYKADEFGKIIEVDDELSKLIKPMMKEEYPDFEAIINMAIEFYPEDVTAKMTPVDWISLFEEIKKKKGKPKKDKIKESQINSQKEETSKDVSGTQKRKATILRVEMPDGKVIQYSNATETYVEIVESNYPDLIEEIDFGFPVIAKEKMPDFKTTKRAQSQLSNGYWLCTNFSTSDKANILQKISDELGLELKIEVIEKE